MGGMTSLSGQKMALNLDNADLSVFVNQVSESLGISPIIIDSEVRGSVTVISGPMSRDDLSVLFIMVLKNNNAALVKDKGIYQIMPISMAIKRGVPIIEKIPEPSTGALEILNPTPKAEATTPTPKAEASIARPSTPFTTVALRPESPNPAPAAKPDTEKPAAANPGEPKQPSSPAEGSTVQRSQQRSGSSSGTTPVPARDFMDNPNLPRLATHVVRVNFIPVRDLVDPIKLFMTDGGVIMPYERLNMMILTDYTDSVVKIMQIVRLLDSNYLDPELVELVKINNNASTDIVDDLQKIFSSSMGGASAPSTGGGGMQYAGGGGRGGGAAATAPSSGTMTGVSFIAMDRLNSVFVVASTKTGLSEIKKWIALLDTTSEKKRQDVVIPIQNTNASVIAQIISMLYGGTQSNTGGQVGTTGTTTGRGGTTGTTGRGGTTGTTGRGGTTGTTGRGGTTGTTGRGGATQTFGGTTGGGTFNSGGNIGTSGTSRTNSLSPQLNSQQRSISSQVLGSSSVSALQDDVRIVADDGTNSIIMNGTVVDIAFLTESIKKLDILPRQAIIDAKIFEVDLTNDMNFGVGGFLEKQGSTVNSTYITDDSRVTSGSMDPGSGNVVLNTIAIVGNARELILKLNALRVKTKVKILESPSVLALDGSQASITVGAQIPYPSGGFVSTGGSTTSVEYRTTGVTLMTVPRISASGSITLDLTTEISSPGASYPVSDTQEAVSFNTTSVSNSFSVKDGQTVAIAGLIRERSESSRTGIPFLSELPLVGSLFGQTSNGSKRSELIIMITPHVIKTPDEAEERTQNLQDSLKNAGKYVVEKDQERAKDIANAQKERAEAEKKATENKSDKPEKPKKSKKSKDSEKPAEPAQSEAAQKPEDMNPRSK